MRDLALRLAALDPEASAALRVISDLDALVAAKAGLQAMRAVAAACPARLEDDEGRISLRVVPDGSVLPADAAPHPTWLYPCRRAAGSSGSSAPGRRYSSA